MQMKKQYQIDKQRAAQVPKRLAHPNNRSSWHCHCGRFSPDPTWADELGLGFTCGIVLPGSYEVLQQAALMEDSVWDRIMHGITTRRYGEVMRELEQAYGIEKSTA
jgi:hypothetical protein